LAQFLFLVGFVLASSHFLTVEDAPAKANAIVVLGGECGGFYRTQHALDLFNNGYAPVIVFSGGTLIGTGLDCSSAQLSLEAAQELGLPAGAFIIADGAQSTYDEAANIRQLAHEQGWHSLIIVTDPFHTRRALRTFRVLLPDIDIYVSAASDPAYDPEHWWQTEDGLVDVFSEVVKLGFYWIRYGIRPF